MRSERTEFLGADGQRLAARIDAPDAHIRAHALFAHCFTCGKDIFAASRIALALADRADAIQLWEPAYTLLKAKKPSIHTLDTQMTKTWTSFAGGERIPYLGVAAHSDWIEQNQALIPKLYATYKEAAEFIAKHPEEAAALIAPKSTPEDRAALVSLIKANDRLGMSVVPASEVAKQIEAVYKAGVDVGYFKSLPSNDTIYVKSMK